MKKLFTILLFCLPALVWSQASNGVDVRNFISPTANFNYDTSATEEIKVRVRNDGPADLLGQDTLLFSMTIGFGDSTEFYDIKKPVNLFLQPNQVADYVLIPAYTFDVANDYVICVTLNGTTTFPTNTTKNPRACVSFVVGLEQQKLAMESVYFANNQIKFSLEKPIQAHLEVLDITGKVLYSKQGRFETESSINFTAPARGFYFLRLRQKDREPGIAKFIVN